MSAGPDPRSSNAQVIEQERRRLSQRLDEVARLCEGTLPASAWLRTVRWSGRPWRRGPSCWHHGRPAAGFGGPHAQ